MSGPSAMPAALRSLVRSPGVAAVLVSALLTLPLLPAPFSPDWLRRPLADDAYYYLVIARDLPVGSHAGGAAPPTSGFQPLYLPICLALGSLAGWDTVAVPMAITVFNWLLYSVAGAWLVQRLWLLLHPEHRGSPMGSLAALLWILAPSGQSICLNGMETTMALLGWVAVALVVARGGPAPRDRRHAVHLGLALGIAFLARNDAVILSLACAALVALQARDPSRPGAAWGGSAGREVAIAMGTAFACALPWLTYVASASGSLIPQGARAEGIGGLYDQGRFYQVRSILEAIVRDVSPVPLPLGSIPSGPRLALCLAALGGLIALAIRLHRGATRPVREVGALLAAGLAGLVLVYATFFGAGHMAARWLSPSFLFGVLVVAEGTDRLRRRFAPMARFALPALLAIIVVGRAAWTIREHGRPSPTNTWELLRYVRTHETRRPIGSFQSGLLAWVLPDIVNLDGKTNPKALEAHLQGRFGPWLRDSGVESVVDSSLLGVERDAAIRDTFILHSTDDGVRVLHRRRD